MDDSQFSWCDGLLAAVTVTDRNGIAIYMNEKSKTVFAKYGGEKLLGTNLLDCHPASAREKMEALLINEKSNSYTIEKNGIKKMIHQCPWYKNGEYAGIVEISFEVPENMPHFVRG
jgi:transcriptional regulator with PAS, ATPase and Fis domain